MAQALGDVQQIVRVHGVLILLAGTLALVGLVLGPREIRIGVALLGGSASLLMLAPVAAGAFNGRYAVPAEPALVASGLLGAWALAQTAVAPSHLGEGGGVKGRRPIPA